MKLALIYDKEDHKLQNTSYSWTYKGMLDALIKRFEDVTHIHNDCYAEDIDADVIIFYDVHSTHHIRIDNIRRHPALKMEYFTDPNQNEAKGFHRQFSKEVHKLGRKQRIERIFERGARYIISPYRDGYYKWLREFLGSDAESMLLWFPISPALEPHHKPIAYRKHEVLANGAIRDGGIGAYDFRRWAFQQPGLTLIPHWIEDKETPAGMEYMDFLLGYAGALALHEMFPVPKYFEMPMAGCVTFAQYYPEYEELGFKDYESCVYVNKDNFNDRISDFLAHPQDFQNVADAGRNLVKSKYTAKHFADFIYNKADTHGI